MLQYTRFHTYILTCLPSAALHSNHSSQAILSGRPGWLVLSYFCFAWRGLVSVHESIPQLGVCGCYVTRHRPFLTMILCMPQCAIYACKRCIKTPSSTLEMLASCGVTHFQVGMANSISSPRYEMSHYPKKMSSPVGLLSRPQF
jgi:hypothetical protein